MTYANLRITIIIAATIAPMIGYRRGFANSKAGPFYPRRLVAKMVRMGDLRLLLGNRHQTQRVTALAKVRV